MGGVTAERSAEKLASLKQQFAEEVAWEPKLKPWYRVEPERLGLCGGGEIEVTGPAPGIVIAQRIDGRDIGGVSLSRNEAIIVARMLLEQATKSMGHMGDGDSIRALVEHYEREPW